MARPSFHRECPGAFCFAPGHSHLNLNESEGAMRLYSLVGADSHVTTDGTRHTPDEAGGFDFPDEVSDAIGGFAVKGKRLWETEGERVDRLHGLEMARRRDPASMLTAMEENAALTRKVTELMAMLTAAQLAQSPAPAPAEAPAAPAGPAEGGDPEPDSKPAPAKAARASRAAKADPSPTGSDIGTKPDASR